MVATTKRKVVRDRMDRWGWTLARMGKALGVSRERVRQLIDADEPGDGRYVARIAAILNTPPTDLVDAEGCWRYL